MIIRDGQYEDLDHVVRLAHEVHDFFPPHLRDLPLNEAQIQRVYVTTMFSEDGFVKLVEEDDGSISGGMVAGISLNGWGLRVASDIFMLAHGGTKKLLTEYKAWAKERGADVIYVTDLCDRPGYREVIKAAGFRSAGELFFGVDSWHK